MIKYFITGLTTIIKFPFYIIKYLLKGIFTVITIIPRYLIIGIKYITEKKDPNNPNQEVLKNKFIPIVTITLSLITYLLSIFLITRWYVQNERNKKFLGTINEDILATKENINKNTPDQYQDLKNDVQLETSSSREKINLNYINVNLDNYKSKNKETVAWIQVNNTNINYPVVQHTDNSYYLEHDFYNRKTDIGWVFGDYRDNFDIFNNNTIIYGHNLINRTMFGQIPYLLYKNWFTSPNSHYIKLSTTRTNSVWEIFSVYKTPPTTDYLQSKFNSIVAYQEFLDMIKKRDEQNLNVEITNTDKIITLSTCDDIGTKRVVVHAKLIKIENK